MVSRFGSRAAVDRRAAVPRTIPLLMPVRLCRYGLGAVEQAANCAGIPNARG